MGFNFKYNFNRIKNENRQTNNNAFWWWISSWLLNLQVYEQVKYTNVTTFNSERRTIVKL